VRPVNDEKLLRNIEQLRYQDLKPQFREGVENLINMVTNNIKPKMVDNVPVNGIGYTKLIQYLVKALNTRGLTEIQNTWERIVQVEMKGVLKNAFSIFENGTKALVDKLPLEDGEFYTHMYNIKIAAGVELNKFRYSTSKCNLMREIFDKRVKSEEDGLISKN
jgi:hypothetical protein